MAVSIARAGRATVVRGVPSRGKHPGVREGVALRGAASERAPRSTWESRGESNLCPTGRRRWNARVLGERRGGSPSPGRTVAIVRPSEGSFARREPARVSSLSSFNAPPSQVVGGLARRPQATRRLGDDSPVPRRWWPCNHCCSCSWERRYGLRFSRVRLREGAVAASHRCCEHSRRLHDVMLRMAGMGWTAEVERSWVCPRCGWKRCRSPKHGGLSVLLGWKAPRVEATALSVTGRRGCDLGLSRRTCRARAGRGQLGGDSGVRRRAEESARTKTPSANSSASSKRAGRRETPGPPVSWPRVQAHGSRAERKLRREAGSYRNVGARWSKRWKAEVGRTHRDRASRRAPRQTAGGRSSSKQLTPALARRVGDSEKESGFG